MEVTHVYQKNAFQILNKLLKQNILRYVLSGVIFIIGFLFIISTKENLQIASILLNLAWFTGTIVGIVWVYYIYHFDKNIMQILQKSDSKKIYKTSLSYYIIPIYNLIAIPARLLEINRKIIFDNEIRKSNESNIIKFFVIYFGVNLLLSLWIDSLFKALDLNFIFIGVLYMFYSWALGLTTNLLGQIFNNFKQSLNIDPEESHSHPVELKNHNVVILKLNEKIEKIVNLITNDFLSVNEANEKIIKLLNESLEQVEIIDEVKALSMKDLLDQLVMNKYITSAQREIVRKRIVDKLTV